MKAIIIAAIVTLGLVLWAHQLPTIGGRVPMVFVALWFGSGTMVALTFRREEAKRPVPNAFAQDGAERTLWRQTMGIAASSLLPFTLVPLLERRSVGNDPAVWLLDAALFISLCTVPYFTLVARTVIGGFALSVGAFQALWICGASVCFRIMEQSVKAKGGQIARGAAFEEFFRRPEYRYLFYILATIMLLCYCPVLLWLGRRRFLRYAKSASRGALKPASTAS
jgi:hypothetical protein